MGIEKENMINFIQILLDAVQLWACCEGIFREKPAQKAKDVIMLPVILLIFIITRTNFIAGGRPMSVFASAGYEIAPANNVLIMMLLILILLLANSLYYKPSDNEYTLCGTMAAFSLYLLARTLSIALFSLCGAAQDLLVTGSRLLSLAAAIFLLRSQFLDWMRKTIRSGGFIVRLVSANISAVLITVLSVLSFDVKRYIENLRITGLILLGLLLLDCGLLYYNQRKIQERKNIRMIEQYVPIVEELISQVRARQHEFNNRIFAIDAAVQSAETLEEAKQSVTSLTKGISLVTNDRELLSCDSKIIAGMLYGKMKQARFEGIDVQIELNGLFKKNTAPETEWIEVIGILLDNALEASARGDTVYLKSRQCKEGLELIVSNPSAPLSNSEFIRLFQKGVTTKENKAVHGFGLYNILCMTERFHGKILTRNEQGEGKNYVVFGLRIP